jgi:hypothetical protein
LGAAPLKEIDDAIATMSAIMRRAGAAVAGGLEIGVEVAADVRWPQSLADVRDKTAKGQPLWDEIKGLVYGELKQRRA